eukprot:4351-Heterococcus_DN1.PRE.1
MARASAAAPKPHTKLLLGFDWHTLRKQCQLLTDECKQRYEEQLTLQQRGNELLLSLQQCKSANDADVAAALPALVEHTQALQQLRSRRREYKGALTHVKQCKVSLSELQALIAAEGQMLSSTVDDHKAAQSQLMQAERDVAALETHLHADVDKLAAVRAEQHEIADTLRLDELADIADEQLSVRVHHRKLTRAWQLLRTAAARSRRLDSIAARWTAIEQQQMCSSVLQHWVVLTRQSLFAKQCCAKRDRAALAMTLLRWQLYTAMQLRFVEQWQRRRKAAAVRAWKAFQHCNKLSAALQSIADKRCMRVHLRAWRGLIQYSSSSSSRKQLCAADKHCLTGAFGRWHCAAVAHQQGDIERVRQLQVRSLERRIRTVWQSWVQFAVTRQRHRADRFTHLQSDWQCSVTQCNAHPVTISGASTAPQLQLTSSSSSSSSEGEHQQQLHIMWRCFSMWHAALARSRRKATAVTVAAVHCERSLLSQGLQHWCSLVAHKRALLHAATAAVERKQRGAAAAALQHWRSLAAKQGVLERRAELVRAAVRRSTLHRAYAQWTRLWTAQLRATTATAEHEAHVQACAAAVRTADSAATAALAQRVRDCIGDLQRAQKALQHRKSELANVSQEAHTLQAEAESAAMRALTAAALLRERHAAASTLLDKQADAAAAAQRSEQNAAQRQQAQTERTLAAVGDQLRQLHAAANNSTATAAALRTQLDTAAAQHAAALQSALNRARSAQHSGASLTAASAEAEAQCAAVQSTLQQLQHEAAIAEQQRVQAAEERARALRQARSMQAVLQETVLRVQARVREGSLLVSEKRQHVAEMQAVLACSSEQRQQQQQQQQQQQRYQQQSASSNVSCSSQRSRATGNSSVVNDDRSERGYSSTAASSTTGLYELDSSIVALQERIAARLSATQQ